MSKNARNAGRRESVSNPLLLPLAITLALLPVIMFPYMADTYALPKATFLYVATLTLFSLYVIQAFRAGEFVIYRSPLDLPVVLFLLVTFLAVLFSGAPVLSILGKYRRYEGLLSLLCYGALYFFAVQSVRTKQHFEKLVSVLAIGMAPVVLYGTAQAIGIDFPSVVRFESRVHSSLGNPILLGSYLVIMLPLLISFIRNVEQEKWKVFAGALVLLGTINLIYTESRGAWLGVVAALAGAFAIRAIQNFRSTKQRRKRQKNVETKNKTLIIGVIGVIALAFIISLVLTPANHFSQRLTSTFVVTEGSAATRIETWKAATRMIADRPVLGYGPEQIGYWFPTYKTARHVMLDPNGMADRAHNEFLQIAVDAGLPGLFLYIWLFAVALWIAIKRGASKQKPYLMGISAALIGYIVQAQTGISALFIAPLVWSLLAISINLSAPHNTLKKLAIPIPKWVKAQVVIPVVLLASFALAAISILPVAADLDSYKGQRLAHTGAIDDASKKFEMAIKLFPYQAQYEKDATEFYLDYASYTQNSIFARRAALIAQQGLAYNARNFELLYYVGETNLLAYRLTSDDMALSDAERYYNQVENIWPGQTLVKRKLFDIALLRDNQKRAEELARKIADMGQADPNLYYSLATYAQKHGDSKTASRYFQKVQQLDPEFLLKMRSN
ncbi:MAG TPA: O-antigen ligase family protein [Candidatus Aquicultor sp.]|jgi:putative inorganic carbon (HCO3(-)) transporter